MKRYWVILLLFVARPASPQELSRDLRIKRLDSLETGVLKSLAMKNHAQAVKNHAQAESQEADVDRALGESRQLGYMHGVAVSLACKAEIVSNRTSDFAVAEKLAREALDTFALTDDKFGIWQAYFTLGFSLFAQSRFDEALSNYEKVRAVIRSSGDSAAELHVLRMIETAYRERGDYEKAFDVQRQCVQLAEATRDQRQIGYQYLALAELLFEIEDYASAEKYFQVASDNGITIWKKDPYDMLVYAEMLTHLHKYDSALYWYNGYDSAHAEMASLRFFLVSKGEYYLCRGDYGIALPYFVQSLADHHRLNDRNQVMRCLTDLARAEAGLHHDSAAFAYAREGLQLAQEVGARQNIRDAFQIFSLLYDRRGRADSAYVYLRRYNALKDSVLNDQLKGKFASYGFEQQVAMISQEKRLDEECLRTEMLTKNLLILGIVALLLLSAIYIWVIRLRRKNEEHRRRRAENELEIQRLEGARAKTALLQRARELEVQALRSQMNPHFIFNCLNAINRFILSHETEAAADYLTKFSRLMRMIMNHSRHATVTLAEEIDMLKLYLDMERLRFRDAFDYSIEVSPDLDAGEVWIPPLLLQPFVENAIWHGLMHKEGRGRLSITMGLRGQVLTCVIRDDGVGRKEAALLKSKSAEIHKSMGMQITAERMALLTGAGMEEPFFTIRDLHDEGCASGTEVTLKISVYDKSDDR